jgi:hypothetical protein
MNLTVPSQGVIKLDRNAWKTFEMLCLSKTWSEIVLIHSGRVIWVSSCSTLRMARRFYLNTAAPASFCNIVYCGRSQLEGNTL